MQTVYLLSQISLFFVIDTKLIAYKIELQLADLSKAYIF